MSARRFNVIAVVAIVLAIVVPLGTRYALAAAKKKKSKRRPVVAAQAQPFITGGTCLPGATVGNTTMDPTAYNGTISTPISMTCNGSGVGVQCIFYVKYGIYVWDPSTVKYEELYVTCGYSTVACSGTLNTIASTTAVNLLNWKYQYLWSVQIYSPNGSININTASCANPGKLLASQNTPFTVQ